MKATTTLTNATCEAIIVEIQERLARELAKPIIRRFRLRCAKEGSLLSIQANSLIREFVLKKMTVTAKVNVTMKELDELFKER